MAGMSGLFSGSCWLKVTPVGCSPCTPVSTGHVNGRAGASGGPAAPHVTCTHMRTLRLPRGTMNGSRSRPSRARPRCARRAIQKTSYARLRVSSSRDPTRNCRRRMMIREVADRRRPLRVQLPTAARTHHERIRGAVVVVGSYVRLLVVVEARRTNAIQALSQLSCGGAAWPWSSPLRAVLRTNTGARVT